MENNSFDFDIYNYGKQRNDWRNWKLNGNPDMVWLPNQESWMKHYYPNGYFTNSIHVPNAIGNVAPIQKGERVNASANTSDERAKTEKWLKAYARARQ